MKRLIIGDIQGCFTELRELIETAGLSTEDEIIAVGDIVDRGPDSPRVLDFFRMQPNTRSLMGNHERKHVRSFHGQTRPALSQRITRRQFGEDRYPDAVAYMDSLPRFFELPEAVVVHAFFEPGVPLAEQREQVIVGTLSGEAYLKQRYDRPWYELYDGEKPIVVGHHDYAGTGQPFVYQDRVFGIDTGCCFGRALTGVIVPDFRFVSVSSRADHWTETKQSHVDLRLASAPDETLTWEKMEQWLSAAEEQSDLPLAARERLLHRKSIAATAERTLTALFAHIQMENKRVLALLRAECAFDKLSAREQGSVYAARIGETPLAEFLHRARKGELTHGNLRKRFKTLGGVIEFAKRVGLLSLEESTED